MDAPSSFAASRPIGLSFNCDKNFICMSLIATLLDAAKPRPSGALMVTRVSLTHSMGS